MVKPLPTGIFMVYYGHSSSLPSRHTAKDPSDLMSSSVRKADEATQNTEWKKRTIKAIRREGEKAKEAARAAARTYPHQTTTSKGTIWRIRTREHHTWIFDHEPTRWERFRMLVQEITDPSIEATLCSEVRPGGSLWFYYQWVMTERETKKKEKMEKKLAKKEEELAREKKKTEEKARNRLDKAASREAFHDSYEKEAWTTWNVAANLGAMKESTKAEDDEVLAAMWPLRRCPGRVCSGYSLF